MSHLSFPRMLIVSLLLLSAVLCTQAFADDAVVHVTLSFDNPVYTNMPVWVHISFPDAESTRKANLRYPYTSEPWFFSANDFDVTFNGQPLPQTKQPGISRIAWSGPINGSAAPTSSPQGRLPLHLCYRFDKPGTYMVRFKAYQDWISKDKKIVAESGWTKLEVQQSSAEQRDVWLDNQIAHQPSDAGMIVGDYLPSLLAQPNKKVLPILRSYLHHEDNLVQRYALEAMSYYSDEEIKEEILRAITEGGPTEAIAFYMSWHKSLFEPIGGQLVDSIIPFLDSNSAKTVGDTVIALNFMTSSSYIWKNQPAISKKIENAVFTAMPHILAFNDRDALLPVAYFLGQIHTEQAHDILWKLADMPSVRDQALICICWLNNPADLKKLGPMLTTMDNVVKDLPYSLYKSYGNAAIPYLLEGVRNGQLPGTIENCAKELFRAKSAEGFLLFKDAIENNRPYKEYIVKVLRAELPNALNASEDELLKLIDKK